MLEGPPKVLQCCARPVWFYTGNIEPTPFGHFFSCKEKVMLLTQCTWDLRTHSIYLGILAVQLILRAIEVNLTFHNSDQTQNHNEGYVLPKGNKSSQWVWFTSCTNAGLSTVEYTAPILISQKREPLSWCLTLLSGRHRSLTCCFPSMTLEGIVGKISSGISKFVVGY